MRIDIKSQNLIIKSLNKVLNKNIDDNINGICIDSRLLKENDIFICLQGERNHGNDFINEDVLNKVSFIVSDRRIINDKVYIVRDSKEFLTNLAIDFRSNLNVKFIGITGTNGKTSTKDLLVHFLKTKFNVSYSRKSYNSTISLPLSILECDEKAQFCVLEMGASKKGEIEYLCNIARPHFGLITNISKAHLDGFSGFKDLVDTKMSIYDFINNQGGTYFLNKDDSNILLSDSSDCSVISFSMIDAKSDYYADISKINKGDICINNNLFKVPYITEIFASNFLSSYSIASTIGISKSDIDKVLKDFCIPDGRGNLIKLPNMRIINDTYNANLESMKKGISQLEEFKNKEVEIKLILGDMLELSEESIEIHNELGRYINSLDFIDSIYAIGNMVKHTLASIDNPSIFKQYFINNQVFIEHLKINSMHGSVIYLKGSRGMKLEQIIDYLKC